MTSSLASYLVDNHFCSLLVRGVKEPHAFLDPSAPLLLKRANGVWTLDASVAYIVKPEALHAIRDTVEDYRIIVCMRNQVERTVSAFAYYKSSLLHPRDSLDLVFGDARTQARLASDPLAPAHLRRGPVGRYAYTAILTTLAGISQEAADALIEEFVQQSFAQRLLYESRYLKEHGSFTPLSMLLHSYYAFFLRQMLDIVDPKRVMLITPTANLPIGNVLATWLGVPPTDALLPSSNASRLSSTEIARARAFCADVLGASFAKETAEVATLAERCLPAVLFSAHALFGKERP